MNVLIHPDLSPEGRNIRLALRLRWPTSRVTSVASESDLVRLSVTVDLVALCLRSPEQVDIADIINRIARNRSTGIIVFARKPSDEEMLDVLEAGADDYLSASVSVTKLVARINALMRRINWSRGDDNGTIEWGPVRVSRISHEASVDGSPLPLTPTEFKLLYHLTLAQGSPITSGALQRGVWDAEEPLYLSSLRQYIQRLRKKLHHAAGSPVEIVAIRGIGYRLSHQETAA